MRPVTNGSDTKPGSVGNAAAPSRVSESIIWLVSVTATPFVLIEWASVWFVTIWTVVHSLAYWTYVLAESNNDSLLWRGSRMLSSIVVWGSVSVTALTTGAYEQHEPLVLLVTFAFVSLRAIVPPDDGRYNWEIDGLVVGTITALCSLHSGQPAFGVAALGGSVFYLMAERAQLRLHEQGRTDRAALDGAIERMTTLAFTDELTSLGNRRAAADWLGSWSEGPATALLFDIDDFKTINDRYGYRVGDEALIAVAATARDSLGAEWTVFRLGGDEFIALAYGRVNLASDYLTPIVFDTISYDGTSVSLEVHISGGTSNVEFPLTLGDAMHSAGPALRIAKCEPGSTIVAASPEAVAEDPWTFSLRVLEGLDNCDFTWWGQPIVDLSTGRPVAVELLCRWPQSDGSVLPPADFLGVIGAFRRQADLGRQSLTEVARWLVALDDAGLGELVVHFNVPPSHLANGLVEDLEEVLDRNQWQRLVVEVLESEMLYVTSTVTEALGELRASGIKVLIDDFGAGHSTFMYLSELAFDGVKLDRALVHEVDLHDRRRAIIRGIAPVFAEMGLVTIAEGVETTGEYDVARDLAVVQGQGWLVARPQPIEECISTLSDLAGSAFQSAS